MSCPTCGAGVTPELRFCLSCGSALARSCGVCGTLIIPGARFCGQCGTRVADGSSEASIPAIPVTEIPAGGVLGGAGGSAGIPQIERRLVSILFADLVGFTTRAESRDAESVREFLTRYFQAAADVVGRYGGTIEKFIGDAVMAVWGTPTTFEDDAERAVRAALGLVDAVRRLGFDGDGTPPVEDRIEVRAAVMTGDAAVTVGATGQGMVAGDLVNSAARLQSVAPPGSVLVDETTMRGTRQAIAYESAGTQSLRGKVAPVPAWRAVRVVAERGGVGRSEGLEAPFVGREEELRLLKDQLHATGREGRARLVSVLGEAGMGKSRLVWEFLKYIDGVTEDIFWHQGRSPAYGEGIAYWALGEMVRRRAGILESEDEADARRKLAETVAQFVSDPVERRWVEPRLAVLLALTDATPGGREELFAAWRTFFERIAEQGTTVLVFEDLHWADDGLLDFIESLLEWSRSRPILVVGLSRPALLDRRPGWGTASRASISLHLDPVSGSRMELLLAGLAPGLPAEAIAHIADRAEGVPLFAVETVRMLLDEGRLVREGDRFRLADPTGGIAVPPSLQALIGARLDALPPDERTLLQHAAVLGRTFSVASLAATGDDDPTTVEARLRALARKELVAVDSDPRSPERGQYGFVHGLVREVAYHTLSRRDRRALHLAAARYFEGLGEDELSGIVASHYLDAWRAAPEGEDGRTVAAQARVALRAAADRALALHASAAAVTYLEQALAVTDDPAERAAIQLRATTPTWIARGWQAAEAMGRPALEYFGSVGDLAHADEATVILARVLIIGSHITAAGELLQPVMARLEDGQPMPQAAALCNEQARVHLFSSRYREALQAIEQGLSIAEHLGQEPEVADLLVSKGWALMELGRRREASIIAQGGLELADRHGIVLIQLRARLNLADWTLREDPRRALEFGAAGIEIGLRLGYHEWAANLVGNSGMACLLDGEWDRVAAWQVLASPSHSLFSRFGALGCSLIGAAYRSGVATFETDPLVPELRASASNQDRSSVEATLAWEAWAAGETDRVGPLARAAFGMSHSAESTIAMLLAARAGIWRDQPGEARAAIECLRDSGESVGRWLEAGIRQVEAALSFIEGGDPGTTEAALRETLQAMRDLGLDVEIAEADLLLLRLFGRTLPDAAERASEARATIDRLGAITLGARLDQVMAAVRSEQVASAS